MYNLMVLDNVWFVMGSDHHNTNKLNYLVLVYDKWQIELQTFFLNVLKHLNYVIKWKSNKLSNQKCHTYKIDTTLTCTDL